MTTVKTITDQDWEATIGAQPALILLTTGDGVRGDFISQFKKSAAENRRILFVQANPATSPRLAEKFNAGQKPLLVGYYNDDVLVRRSRPWGTDVVLAIELLENAYKEGQPTMANETPDNAQPAAIVNDKPVAVTDVDFQQQVIDYSNAMPVLVDFWAEWCGPCRMVAPIMETLAAEFAGQIRVAKVDVDSNPGLSQAFRVMSIPTIMAFKDGHMVFSQPGAFPEEAFRDLISQLIALDVQAAIAEQEAQQANEQ